MMQMSASACTAIKTITVLSALCVAWTPRADAQSLEQAVRELNRLYQDSTFSNEPTYYLTIEGDWIYEGTESSFFTRIPISEIDTVMIQTRLRNEAEDGPRYLTFVSLNCADDPIYGDACSESAIPLGHSYHKLILSFLDLSRRRLRILVSAVQKVARALQVPCVIYPPDSNETVPCPAS